MLITTSPIVPADLLTCDREPIHLPGSIQPHGVLFALDEPDLRIAQCSSNTGTLLGRQAAALLGQPVGELFAPEDARALRTALTRDALEGQPLYLRTLTVQIAGEMHSFHALAHRHDGVLILELELSPAAGEVSFHDLDPLVRSFLGRLEEVHTTTELLSLAVDEVRRVTGFDRVMAYQFDPQWNGRVVAERRDEQYPSYLDLHFPASDIPRQARELYRLNRLRMIVDGRYSPVPIVPTTHPRTGRPLDLSFAALRSVSRVHLEYLRNFSVVASMSVSILRDGRLWGLIACHHYTPRLVPFAVRTACDLIAQMLALQLAAHERREYYALRLRLEEVQAALLSRMAREEHFVDGLIRRPDLSLSLTGAAGLAVLSDGRCELVGQTPPDEVVRRLGAWLARRDGPGVFATERLVDLWPEAAEHQATAAGLLAVSISRLNRSFVLWFRPEVVRTVNWSGDPRKPVDPENSGRLNPRRSFEKWKELVRGRSLPWQSAEVEAATSLRTRIVDIVLHKAEELAQLAAELRRSNEELEAFSYSISHDLRAPYRHIVGYAQLVREEEAGQLTAEGRRYIDTVIESAEFAGKLVDHLLQFSRMSRTTLAMVPVDLNEVVAELQRDLSRGLGERQIDWRIAPLPVVRGDLMMLRMALSNLLSNAIKFTGKQPAARIEVSCSETPRETILRVHDNGAGFDMRYADKLFGVFQRLHHADEFEGDGIGLATVRRILARHGGRVWADSAPGQGATFFLALPKKDGNEETDVETYPTRGG